MDLLATCCSLAGIEVPNDRILDSYDLTPALRGAGRIEREAYFYYRGYQLMAARLGPWKAHFQTQAGYGQPQPETHDPPLLFHLEHDPSEKHPLPGNTQVQQAIAEAVAAHKSQMQFAPSQLE